jgi:putative ABC transport system permease protein
MYLDYIKLVLRDINRRKFSSFLTLFAISLGILTIFVIFLLGQGFEDSIETQFNQFGSNRLYVSSSTANLGSTTVTKGLTDSEVDLIESRPYVDIVYPYYAKSSQVEFSKEFKQIQVLGSNIGQSYFEEFNLEVGEGRFPKSNEKFAVVMGPLAATEIYSKDIRVGSNLIVEDTKFKVVGILESLGNPQDDRSFYFNIDSIRDLFDAGDNVGFLDVVLVENYDVDLAASNLKILLENKLGEDSVSVISPSQLLDQFNSILTIVKVVLGGIGVVALIVGALGIVNTMYVIVTEKKKEIGIMKSVGGRNSDIMFIFVFQAGFFGFLGALLGVILGSFAAIGFEAVAQSSGFTFLEIKIVPEAFFGLLIFGFLMGCFAGFLPALKASRTNIIDAIRK